MPTGRLLIASNQRFSWLPSPTTRELQRGYRWHCHRWPLYHSCLSTKESIRPVFTCFYCVAILKEDQRSTIVVWSHFGCHPSREMLHQLAHTFFLARTTSGLLWPVGRPGDTAAWDWDCPYYASSRHPFIRTVESRCVWKQGMPTRTMVTEWQIHANTRIKYDKHDKHILSSNYPAQYGLKPLSICGCGMEALWDCTCSWEDVLGSDWSEPGHGIIILKSSLCNRCFKLLNLLKQQRRKQTFSKTPVSGTCFWQVAVAYKQDS